MISQINRVRKITCDVCGKVVLNNTDKNFDHKKCTYFHLQISRTSKEPQRDFRKDFAACSKKCLRKTLRKEIPFLIRNKSKDGDRDKFNLTKTSEVCQFMPENCAEVGTSE